MDTFSHGPLHRGAVPQHLACRCLGKARKDSQQRRFSGTRRPQQRQNLSRINSQIQRRNHLDPVVARLVVKLLHLSCFNQRLRHSAIIAAKTFRPRDICASSSKRNASAEPFRPLSAIS